MINERSIFRMSMGNPVLAGDLLRQRGDFGLVVDHAASSACAAQVDPGRRKFTFLPDQTAHGANERLPLADPDDCLAGFAQDGQNAIELANAALRLLALADVEHDAHDSARRTRS